MILKRLLGCCFSTEKENRYPIIFFSPAGGKEYSARERTEWRSFRISGNL